MPEIYAARRINSKGMRRDSPILIASRLKPEQVDTQVYGEKAQGLVKLHTLHPHVSASYIPVDGLFFPANGDLTQYQSHQYAAFRALTRDVAEKTCLIVRGSKYQEQSGETLSEVCLYDPARTKESFDNVYQVLQRVIDTQNRTAAILQFMVGRTEEYTDEDFYKNDEEVVGIPAFGPSNTTFYAASPEPRGKTYILINFIKGLGFQQLSANDETMSVTLRRDDLSLQDFEILKNQYYKSSYDFKQSRYFYLQMDSNKAEMTEKYCYRWRPIEEIGRWEQESVFCFVSLQQLQAIGRAVGEIEKKVGHPVEIEGTELDQQVFLYQLQKGFIDPRANIKLSDKPQTTTIRSGNVRGVWNGRINLLFYLTNYADRRNKILDYMDNLRSGDKIGTGVFTNFSLEYAGFPARGKEEFIKTLSLFATTLRYSPMSHIVTRVRQWIGQGLPLTFMQAVKCGDFDYDRGGYKALNELLERADQVFANNQRERAFLIKDVVVESNGSEGQLIFK